MVQNPHRILYYFIRSTGRAVKYLNVDVDYQLLGSGTTLIVLTSDVVQSCTWSD